MPAYCRPSDIPLPQGWTWDRVEAERSKWDIAANMIPIATAPGVVAWGTINSVRKSRACDKGTIGCQIKGQHVNCWVG